MDDNAVTALNMAFAVIILVFALSLAIYMFSMVASTSETLAFYSDSTIYYDNVELVKYCANCGEANSAVIKFCTKCNTEFPTDEDSLIRGTSRIVSAETIIPTLYRYYKENFCVKICGVDGKLIQIFDVYLEGKANATIGYSPVPGEPETVTSIQNEAYKETFGTNATPEYRLFGAPWLGNPELVKLRVDLFVNGKSGYINDKYVEYTDNLFYQARQNDILFKEEFINYSYTGQTLETEDGDSLVVGANAKDKTIIIYTMLQAP